MCFTFTDGGSEHQKVSGRGRTLLIYAVLHMYACVQVYCASAHLVCLVHAVLGMHTYRYTVPLLAMCILLWKKPVNLYLLLLHDTNCLLNEVRNNFKHGGMNVVVVMMMMMLVVKSNALIFFCEIQDPQCLENDCTKATNRTQNQ